MVSNASAWQTFNKLLEDQSALAEYKARMAGFSTSLSCFQVFLGLKQDQTVGNSGDRRIGHATPVKNLYLAGAWSRPGHGYGGVLQSGPECFAEIVRS